MLKSKNTTCEQSYDVAIERHSGLTVPGDFAKGNFLCCWSHTFSLLCHSCLGCGCRSRGESDIVPS